MEKKSWDVISAEKSRRRGYTRDHENHLPADFDVSAYAGTFSVREGSELGAQIRSSAEEALERVRRTQRFIRIVRIARVSLGFVGVLVALYLGATKR